jgi:ferrochelatase
VGSKSFHSPLPTPHSMKRGVLLLNLGGPETLEDVSPFLYNLFSDPDIIRIKNHLVRKLLARLITFARHRKSENLYRQIGGGSPLRRITESQAAALESLLRIKGFECRVYVAMRCWKPGIEESAARILQERITHLTLLPLFPQYSGATSGSCLRYFETIDKKIGISEKIEIRAIKSWFDEPLYLECMADLIREGLRKFSTNNPGEIRLLYSAHSIPARYAAAGDPYPEQIRQSMELIDSRLGNTCRSALSFQSKIGPVKWLGPSTKDVLAELGRSGNDRVLAVPISFVSDHLETLQEIDILYKRLAFESGIKEFYRAAAPNLHPKFIEALANVVIRCEN